MILQLRAEGSMQYSRVGYLIMYLVMHVGQNLIIQYWELIFSHSSQRLYTINENNSILIKISPASNFDCIFLGICAVHICANLFHSSQRLYTINELIPFICNVFKLEVIFGGCTASSVECLLISSGCQSIL